MNMEELQTMEGVQKLKEDLRAFLKENPKPEEKVMARITELAHHLESDKLKMQAGQIIGRCSEVDDMIKKKLKTINAAEKRFQVRLLDPLFFDVEMVFIFISISCLPAEQCFNMQ